MHNYTAVVRGGEILYFFESTIRPNPEQILMVNKVHGFGLRQFTFRS